MFLRRLQVCLYGRHAEDIFINLDQSTLRVALKTVENEEPKIFFLPKAFTSELCTVFAIQTMKQLVEASRYPFGCRGFTV
ncbi:hypothetical protein TNCV_3039221 [Trichonephila clavipes]|nr:hypothetical protein TNCV_3039221 [Trichonephila clavipes]